MAESLLTTDAEMTEELQRIQAERADIDKAASGSLRRKKDR